ncbi:MAG: ComEA family DNA-binding protein [Gemmatimonadetes bacterium]|nr:ComEA family DNA-binding protein [Gemmatimonadota bacterium]
MLSVTPQERLALGVTALLLAAGAGARVLTPGPAPVQWEQKAHAASDTKGVDAAATRRAAERALAKERIRAEPLRPGERIDPNRASVDEIDRLPRIGPALAARIVERRAAHGPFRSLADLDSVPGVGPALLREIAPSLQLPASPARGSRRGGAAAKGALLDLNRATTEELDALPGIGPVLARRIVERREASGPFRSVEDLEQVPGIGPALREKLAASVRAGP